MKSLEPQWNIQVDKIYDDEENVDFFGSCKKAE